MSAEKPLILYTGSSPNGYKTSITLEELKAAYGSPDYDYFPIDTATNIQKEPWYIEINPNGRIPALIDRSRGGFKVFESAAIELYLVEHYDKGFKISFDREKEPDFYSEMLQWIFFAHGGTGPMQGQAFHFIYGAPEKIPYAIKRYQDETKRLLGVLDIRLTDRDYLAGPDRGKYTIADTNAWPWVRIAKWAQVTETLEEWPNVKAWHDRIEARPAVQAGINTPPEGWNKK